MRPVPAKKSSPARDRQRQDEGPVNVLYDPNTELATVDPEIRETTPEEYRDARKRRQG